MVVAGSGMVVAEIGMVVAEIGMVAAEGQGAAMAVLVTKSCDSEASNLKPESAAWWQAQAYRSY